VSYDLACICVGRYIGHSNGDISVLMLDQEPSWRLVKMKYTIPLSASYGEKHIAALFLSPSHVTRKS